MASLQTLSCHQCGESLPDNAKFCSACGMQIGPVVVKSPPAAPLIESSINQTAKHKRIILGCIGGFVFLLIILAFVGGSKTVTVQDYIQTERQKLETMLNTKPNEFGKHIENIHLTVTYKGGHVKSMTATTVDGSNNAGKNGSNIAEVDVVVTAYWEGYVQKNGFTEMELVYDNLGDKLKSAKYLDSNAVINVQTVDWFKVGFAVGRWLM